MAYDHLRLEKEMPITERHRRQNKKPKFAPDDPRAFAENLQHRLQAVKVRLTDPSESDVGGFDDRKLLKIILREDEQIVPQLSSINGLEIVSHEDKVIVLAFVTPNALELFEQRLATLARDGTVTRKDVLFAINDFSKWMPQDRKGNALIDQGFPEQDLFTLDIELWPQERRDRRQEMIVSFREWVQQQNIEELDGLLQPSLVMLRVRCNQDQAEQILRHRDVRTVDLPPRWGVTRGTVRPDVNRFDAPVAPDQNSPLVAVLDSGLVTGHPLLAPAVGHAQGYVLPHRSPDDTDPWHGTAVAGLALYGDIETSIMAGDFRPRLFLLSAKVFNNDGSDETEFVENAIERAVRDLHEGFGCRVYNLSYGDLNKVYMGGHLRGLAYTLDRLTRELGVLFVVSTGNLSMSDLPEDPIAAFPEYLFDRAARLVDPATALNAVTVGGIARHEATDVQQVHPDMIEAIPISRSGHPFPLTRSGPTVIKAIKPDFVEHAGNIAIGRTQGQVKRRGLGVVTTNGGFVSGSLFMEDIGTSLASPIVAHRAAKILRFIPNASQNLLRALLGAHADWPRQSRNLLNPDDNAVGSAKLRRLVGYGCVNDAALERSFDNIVSLVCEERISNDQCQFFTVPIPEEIWEGGRREREISVSLAYSPEVRTTRLDYRMTKLKFNLVKANSLDEVEAAFRKNRVAGMSERNTNRWITDTDRSAGTLQVSRWKFKIRPRGQLFVVVTRQDESWSTVIEEDEPYALCVTIADRTNTESQLYNQISAILRARVVQRARV